MCYQNICVHQHAMEKSLKGLAKSILSGDISRITFLVGAGISCSAGIPDFRSKGTGIYDNLQKFSLPYPEAIFELEYFENRPEAFFILAKELFPGNYMPTPAHYFMRLLCDKNLVQRVYTQNIDTLERVSGIAAELLVEAHGSFGSCHCLRCGTEYSQDWMKTRVLGDILPRCGVCKGLVKPDIVFFGENLPRRYHRLAKSDARMSDCLLVMGTSLQVWPVAGLCEMFRKPKPRVLINMEEVGEEFFDFKNETSNDILHLSKCDEAVINLINLLGWKEEFDALIKSEFERLKHDLVSTNSTTRPTTTTTIQNSNCNNSILTKNESSGSDSFVEKANENSFEIKEVVTSSSTTSGDSNSESKLSDDEDKCGVSESIESLNIALENLNVEEK